jgi:putative effector of murein hydrolase LrgA (UPF0299 family)
MGIMELWGLVKMDFLAWVGVVVLSTILVLLAAAYTQQGVESLESKLKRRK